MTSTLPAIEQTATQAVIYDPTRQSTTPTTVSPAVQQQVGEPSSPPSNVAHSAQPTAPRALVSGSNGRPIPRNSRPITDCLLKTSVGKIVTILDFVITVIGLILTLFSGVASYSDMRWSEHNNVIQTCASLYVRHNSRPHLIRF